MAGPLEELVFAVAKEIGCPTAPLEAGWELTVPIADSRAQAVRMQGFTHEKVDFVRFATNVGAKDRLTPAQIEKALGLNRRLPFGCLAIDGADLVMTAALPLAAATVPHAAAILHFLASQADFYESALFGCDVH